MSGCRRWHRLRRLAAQGSLEQPLEAYCGDCQEDLIAFERIEDLEAVISEASLNLEQIPREALFLAGKAFLSYRRRRPELP
jgi:hypothetical protein